MVLLLLSGGLEDLLCRGNVAQGVGEDHSLRVRLWPRNSATTMASGRRTVTS